MERRQVATVFLACALVTLAGCGFITGEQKLAFEATPATVENTTLQETGYEEVEVAPQVFTQNITVADQTRTIQVTNQLAQYERPITVGGVGSVGGALFVTFTSPEVTVFDQTINPIAGLSPRDILREFDAAYSGIQVDRSTGNQTVQTLGTSVRFERFDGRATIAGQEVPVAIHAANFVHDSDHVVAIGVYPQSLDSEGQTVVRLLETLEHDRADGAGGY